MNESDIKEIEVDMFEYKKATAPDILRSGGLGPCIAVGAIYGRKGYMAHYSSVLNIPEELNALLSDLKKEVKNLSRLKLYVAGAGVDYDDIRQGTEESILEGRKETLEKIANAGLSDKIQEIRWARGNSNQELILLLSENRAIYDEYPDENFGEDFDDGVRK